MLQRNNRALMRAGMALCALSTVTACQAYQRPDEPIALPRGTQGQRVAVRQNRRMYVENRAALTERGRTATLFVHGFASNRDTWAMIEPALRQDRATIAVDLPGFGLSDRTEGDYSPYALADDLVTLLDHLGVPRCDVVAHSWGSSVALALAMRHPTRIRRLVVIGAWVYEEQIPPFFRWAREPGVGEGLFELFYRERLEDRAPMGFAEGTEVPQATVDAIERSLERPGTLRAALAAVRGQYYAHMESQYRTIAARSLVMYGEDDRVALPRYGARLARELQDGRMVTVGASGHFPMFEAPGTVRRLVRDFLDAPEDQAPPASVAVAHEEGAQ
ncbi:MAG: alpha/beta fold hydrolase [Deltaproteobacteria bacterium]|nr:alpha/beta fold hydrolase [Deltaproteobacteria bacterium]